MISGIEYTTIAKVSLETYLDICEIMNFQKSMRRRFWVYLITTDNLVCPSTNKKVAYCGFDICKPKKGEPTYHFNFYSEDGVMFTIDHKIPKSKGGSNWFDNVQPMICFDNWEKSNKLIFT